MRWTTTFAAVLLTLTLTGISASAVTLRENGSAARKGEHAAEFDHNDLLGWRTKTVDGLSCLVSPVINAAGNELNHHRLTVTYSGEGSIQASIAHHPKADLKTALEKKYFHSKLRRVASGEEITVASPYRGERNAWIVLHIEGKVTVKSIEYACYSGRNTLYGHIPLTYEFGGAKLPYRLLLPKQYDPNKSYPLVLSIAGSGSIGNCNVRNMEMIILARYLFTQYREDDRFECFSLVPQIPADKTVPGPFYPNGSKGAPSPWHPDWPAVNAEGWYTQATLSLVKTLIADPRLNIDADRVYLTGYSYGGKACWEFLKAAPDTFAAAISGGGWPVGRAYGNPTGMMLDRLGREVRIYKDVPVWIFAGGADPMRFGSKAVHEQIQAAGGQSRYTEFPATKHIPAAGKIWSKPEHVTWLFDQSRKTRTAKAGSAE